MLWGKLTNRELGGQALDTQGGLCAFLRSAHEIYPVLANITLFALPRRPFEARLAREEHDQPRPRLAEECSHAQRTACDSPPPVIITKYTTAHKNA